MRGAALRSALAPALGVFCLLLPAGAAAHSLSRSISEWTLDETGARVVARVPVIELSRRRAGLLGLSAPRVLMTAGDRAWVEAYISGGLNLVPPCEARDVSSRAAGPKRIEVRWRLDCPAPPEAVIRCDAFFDEAPSHVHFVRVRDGERWREAALTAGSRTADLRPAAAEGAGEPGGAPDAAGLGDFIRLGTWHVAIGPDHLAFVVALMLLGGTLLGLIVVATGFTIGHSLTLAVAATGVLRADEATVEVLVGLSITFVALECFHAWGDARRRGTVLAVNAAIHLALAALLGLRIGPGAVVAVAGSALFTTCHVLLIGPRGVPTPRHRSLIALLFGLVHGFAFATVFREVMAGAEPAVALLGFNIGVELAQIAVIALTVGALAAIRRFGGPGPARLVSAAAAAVVLALGFSWTFSRALTLAG